MFRWKKKEEEFDYSKPFRVWIIEDCRRKSEKSDGKLGTCLGLYTYSHINKADPDGTPLIRIDDGKYIWGCECWWAKEEWSKDIPLEKLRKALQKDKEKIRKKVGLEDKF